jgi:hypothetical protein
MYNEVTSGPYLWTPETTPARMLMFVLMVSSQRQENLQVSLLVIMCNSIHCTFDSQALAVKRTLNLFTSVLDNAMHIFICNEARFFFSWTETKSTSVLRPLFGLLYQPQMIDDDYGAICRMPIDRGKQSNWIKPASMSLCPPQISHVLTRARTWTAVVGEPMTNRLS